MLKTKKKVGFVFVYVKYFDVKDKDHLTGATEENKGLE